MKIHCEYLKENELGVFRLAGEKSFEDAREVWEKIRFSIQNDHLKGVLVFDNAASKLRVHEVIKLTKYMEEINFPCDVKVAIVDPRPPLHSNNAFGETVAHNRMWQLIVVFSDESSARVWLSQ
jgi:hypothetical protein